MARTNLKFTLDLSDYTPAQREAIASEVIDRIVARTKQGKDKEGNTFAPYSKSYKESLDFKIGGKSSKVNLTLSGDMLDSIELLRNGPKTEIGYRASSPERGKAEGNILGTYGNPSPVAPPRDFLGISPEELSKILKNYTPKSEADIQTQRTKAIDAESRRIADLLGLQNLDEA